MITSSSNPLISLAKSLLSTKHRNETGLFLLEGEKFVAHALQNAWEPVRLLVDEAHFPLYEHHPQVRLVEKRLFSSFCSATTPQGVAAIFEKPTYPTETILGRAKNILFLNAVQDSANVGALIRSCDCAGFDFVLLDEGCCDPYSPKAMRSSAGSALDVPLLRTKDAFELLNTFAREGYTLVGTSLEGEETLSFEQTHLHVLLLGSEGQGLHPSYQALCTKVVKLPMRGKAQSLNVAAAGVLLMYKINHLL